MTRIAFIIGCSGAGKSYTANLFNNRAHVIHIDQIVGQAIMRLCPFMKPGVGSNRELWKSLLKYTDAADAIGYAIQHCYPTNQFNNGQPIVVEGTMLSCEEWRDTFVSALKKMGVVISSSEIFLLDVQPNQLFENIQRRGRKKEKHLKLQNVRNQQKNYYSQISDQPIKSFKSTDLLAQNMELFLFGDSQVTQINRRVA